MTKTAIDIITLGTLITHIGVAIGIVLYFVFKKNNAFRKVTNFLRNNGLWIAFIAALASTLGSLYFSEIAHFAPCKLCWIQRIFMYPQVVLLGIAIWKQDTKVKIYSITLAIIGSIVALYHYALQKFPEVLSSGCSLDGIDCSVPLFMRYGYISFPMMSLTAFIVIIVSLWTINSDSKVSEDDS